MRDHRQLRKSDELNSLEPRMISIEMHIQFSSISGISQATGNLSKDPEVGASRQ